MMTEHENLARVMAESLIDVRTGPLSDAGFLRAEIEQDGTLSLFKRADADAWEDGSVDVPQLAAAVVAFLTGDEAVERAARVTYDSYDGTTSEVYREVLRTRMRAAILAALGAESLPLDPEPWVGVDGRRYASVSDFPIGEFYPRGGYELRIEFYEKGGEGRVLMTHPHDGHRPGDRCLECEKGAE